MFCPRSRHDNQYIDSRKRREICGVLFANQGHISEESIALTLCPNILAWIEVRIEGLHLLLEVGDTPGRCWKVVFGLRSGYYTESVFRTLAEQIWSGIVTCTIIICSARELLGTIIFWILGGELPDQRSQLSTLCHQRCLKLRESFFGLAGCMGRLRLDASVCALEMERVMQIIGTVLQFDNGWQRDSNLTIFRLWSLTGSNLNQLLLPRTRAHSVDTFELLSQLESRISLSLSRIYSLISMISTWHIETCTNQHFWLESFQDPNKIMAWPWHSSHAFLQTNVTPDAFLFPGSLPKTLRHRRIGCSWRCMHGVKELWNGWFVPKHVSSIEKSWGQVMILVFCSLDDWMIFHCYNTKTIYWEIKQISRDTYILSYSNLYTV